MLFNNDNYQPANSFSPWSNPEHTEINSDLPSELQDFFAEHEVDPKFKITVQSFNNEQYTGRPSIVGEFNGEVPNYEKLVKMNGAKFYRYKIVHKKDGIVKTTNIDADLSGKNWIALSKEGDRERRQNRNSEIRDDMEERNAMLAYGGVNQGPQPSAQDAFKDTLEMMTPLLMLMKGGDSGGGMGMEKMMMFMMQMQSTSQNQMMQMFGMMNKNQSDMMISMRGGGDNEMMKVFNIAEKMIGIKQLVSPKEEGLIEKIGNFIGDNMDTLGMLLAKPQEQREQDSGYQKTKEDWRFKKVQEKMQGNKAFAQKLIKHLDGKIGAETTDGLLEGFLKYNRKEAEPDTPAEEVETEPVPNSEITEDDFKE